MDTPKLDTINDMIAYAQTAADEAGRTGFTAPVTLPANIVSALCTEAAIVNAEVVTDYKDRAEGAFEAAECSALDASDSETHPADKATHAAVATAWTRIGAGWVELLKATEGEK